MYYRVDRRRPSCQLKKEEEQEVPCKDLIIAIGWKQRDHSDLEKRSAKDRYKQNIGFNIYLCSHQIQLLGLCSINSRRFGGNRQSLCH